MISDYFCSHASKFKCNFALQIFIPNLHTCDSSTSIDYWDFNYWGTFYGLSHPNNRGLTVLTSEYSTKAQFISWIQVSSHSSIIRVITRVIEE